jgi:hypothetical protein
MSALRGLLTMKKRLLISSIFLFLSIHSTSAKAAQTAGQVWKPFRGGTEDMEFGILSTIDGVSVAGPNALETGYNGAYSFPRSPYDIEEGDLIGWGQSFTVATTQKLAAVQLRIAKFSIETPTGLIEVSVSEFNPNNKFLGRTLASTILSASNFNIPLGFDVPIFTVDLSASGAQLDAATTYMLSLKSLGGFGTTSVAPYAATDIYSGGNSYYLSEELSVSSVPEPSTTLTLLAFGSLGTGSVLLRKKK